MNHKRAADIRDYLNQQRYVEGPDDSGPSPMKLVRVQQPGYLNGSPMYEVVIRLDNPDSFNLSSDFIDYISETECYLRIEGEDIHIRDWEAADKQIDRRGGSDDERP